MVAKISSAQSHKIRDFWELQASSDGCFRGELPFSPIFFLLFLPLSMAKSDEGKKMGAPAGLRDSILPCVPRPLGLLNACTWNLFLSLPAAPHMCPFVILFSS
ncbi:hypothetical protein Pyn_37428 [Prunus yedoensis var. nudiflora]|uniref:Uncharacterized protein n=1 Tax=Prunus yedoensis var. nudiflora TaxID=2094558 RepID=A0A314YU40_PRUYE|nr:hypothetical protein Pyn_37428 [Prunus yedoensis var. nudiflora]